ncbi:type II toxin-antitoxin system VapC family toxin [Luteimicrobium subarcticum]|uniref:PIN domain nuclease of toxin-antitoxin system n=1 Tax=Luteimicrobium subarcticum TaxID=620910 RepID=A0A2M8WT67_9MICO|nr:type II toxin-antitoxin system VapC family toxin [Luteimicrobium subarcticum]PJI94141.1 PIN domain nuclease of toxin-antitoxin system [Luteimicrobium subarcticum]
MAVTYLLDTHVVLWMLGDPARLSAAARPVVADPRAGLVVSAVSALEVATKVRIGRLPGAEHLVATWEERLTELRLAPLPVTAPHALLAGSLAWDHRDPFDRLLAAQALHDNLVLVTSDAALRALPGLRTLW